MRYLHLLGERIARVIPGSGRNAHWLFLLCFLANGGVSAESADAAAEELLREAYAQSPSLRAAHARWEAALEKVPQARSLPDPRLGYGIFVRRMETRQVFRVEQMFPGPGKRNLEADIASEAAEAAADELESVAADVRRNLLVFLAEWIAAQQSEVLIKENLRLVEKLEQVALQRYRSGEVSQADVLRLQMEADTLRIELAGWGERERPLRARANAVLGRAPDHALPPLKSLPTGLVRPGDPGFTEDLKANPDLKQRRSRIREASQRRELARLASRPDFSVGAEFMDNRGGARNEVMGMFSVTLPVWRERYAAVRREAQAGLRAAEWDYESALRGLEAEARLARFEYEDARRRVELYVRSLLPRARQALAILEAEYQTGSAAFLDLLEAQRRLLDLELSLIRARTDLFVRAADWERMSGPFPGEAITQTGVNH